LSSPNYLDQIAVDYRDHSQLEITLKERLKAEG
jgi:hypothetical protein